MKFNKILKRERMAKEFDMDESFTKQNKTMKYYDFIQENRKDTEIYQVLNDYGCIDKMVVDKTAMFDDFTKFKDLRDLKDKQLMAENMFNQLPSETKMQFGNSMHNFIKNGEAWLAKEIAKEQAQNDLTQATTATTEELPKGE